MTAPRPLEALDVVCPYCLALTGEPCDPPALSTTGRHVHGARIVRASANADLYYGSREDAGVPSALLRELDAIRAERWSS